MSKDKLIPELRFPEFKNEGGWVEKTLEEVTEVNPTSSQLPEVFVYVDLESVENGTLLKKRTIEKEGAPSRAQRLLKDKDVIFQMVRPYQKNNYYFKKSDNLNYVASTGYAQLRAFESSMFLYQLIHTNMFVSKVLKKCTGSNYPAINSSDLSKISVQIPNPQEQQKIASCLSSLDEVIAAHSQKLVLLKDHKKGLMQILFPQEGEKVPKYRFKEFEKDGEWVEKSLDKLTDKIGDGIHTTPKYDPSGGFYFINGNNLIEGKIVVDEKTKRVSSKEFEIHKKDLTEKTIFLSINGTIGNLAFYNNEMVVLGKSACYITPSQKLNNVFLYYSLKSPRIIDYFFSELTGSTIKNLSLKSIRETLIYLPSEKEQQKIASCLSSLDALITAQAEKIEQLKLHKKGLMQGLFPKINE